MCRWVKMHQSSAVQLQHHLATPHPPTSVVINRNKMTRHQSPKVALFYKFALATFSFPYPPPPPLCHVTFKVAPFFNCLAVKWMNDSLNSLKKNVILNPLRRCLRRVQRPLRPMRPSFPPTLIFCIKSAIGSKIVRFTEMIKMRSVHLQMF